MQGIIEKATIFFTEILKKYSFLIKTVIFGTFLELFFQNRTFLESSLNMMVLFFFLFLLLVLLFYCSCELNTPFPSSIALMSKMQMEDDTQK